jgi:isochorismate synthase
MRSEPSLETYRRGVAEALRRIDGGALRKVVLARSLVVRAAHAWDPVALLRRLRAADPAAYVFSVPVRGPDPAVLVGASPELLLRRRGREIVSNPLAGSARRSGDEAADRDAGARLLANEKERREHAFVVEAARDALAPFCAELHVDAEPRILATARVMHLSTVLRGRLRDPEPSALHLAAALHPTPAVCGTPLDEARRAIDEIEGIDRGLYAGLVGWVNGEGDGEWALTLRCAELRGDTAVLFAGAGIVAGSEPQAELDETDAKLATLLDALAAG